MRSLRSVVQRWLAVPTQANTADLTTMSTWNIVTRVSTLYYTLYTVHYIYTLST